MDQYMMLLISYISGTAKPLLKHAGTDATTSFMKVEKHLVLAKTRYKECKFTHFYENIMYWHIEINKTNIPLYSPQILTLHIK